MSRAGGEFCWWSRGAHGYFLSWEKHKQSFCSCHWEILSPETTCVVLHSAFTAGQQPRIFRGNNYPLQKYNSSLLKSTSNNGLVMLKLFCFPLESYFIINFWSNPNKSFPPIRGGCAAADWDFTSLQSPVTHPWGLDLVCRPCLSAEVLPKTSFRIHNYQFYSV